jgi:hypothetical protein
MKRNSSSRPWVILGVSAALFIATSVASRRFPPAPLQPASIELRARLDSLRAFDAAGLAKVRERRVSVGAAALPAAHLSEIRTNLAQTWETTALPPQTSGQVSIIRLTLRRSGDWRQSLGAVRQVQQIPGVSVSAASVFTRGSVLSVELHANIVVHTQPADDKASGLPAVVRSPQIR